MKYRISRDQRQIQGLRRWSDSDYCGIAQYPTGFGKTYTAIRAIKGMIKRKNIKSVQVVVPTITLKEQWEKELKKHKITIAKVLVINTAVKRKIDVDFLILDEIHRFAADTFKNVFKVINYNFILGLTATLERADGLHEIILNYLSVFDTISVEEALENNWVSPFKIYNVEVPFTEEEAIAYRKADNGFKHFAAKLGGKFDAFSMAKEWIKSDDKKEQGIAAAYYNSMRSRKKICLNNSNKIGAIKRLVETFSNRNGLLFNADTNFADAVQKELGDYSMTFHSKLTKKQQQEVIKRFKDKRTKIRILSTVRALNEGFDVPECSFAIIAGSNSTRITMIQQLGRIVRFVEGKEAILINLYTPGTQEEVWMNKRLSSFNPEFIHDIALERLIKMYK